MEALIPLTRVEAWQTLADVGLSLFQELIAAGEETNRILREMGDALRVCEAEIRRASRERYRRRYERRGRATRRAGR